MDFVLLTAAVTPAPQFNAALSDPSVRLSQYQEAVASWASRSGQLGWQIVIVETTGCPAPLLTAKVDTSMKDRITVIPFLAGDEFISLGKGSVEAAAIDHALNSGAADIAEDSTFFKATGRLVVKNASDLLTRLPNNTAVVRRSLDGKYCDTRFFGTTVKFWNEHLSGMGTDVDDNEGRYIEHVLAHRLRETEYRERSLIQRFATRPDIDGQSGTTGAKYGRLGTLTVGSLLKPIETVLASRFSSKQV